MHYVFGVSSGGVDECVAAAGSVVCLHCLWYCGCVCVCVCVEVYEQSLSHTYGVPHHSYRPVSHAHTHTHTHTHTHRERERHTHTETHIVLSSGWSPCTASLVIV